MISGRYSNATIKYIGTLFDRRKPKSYIINLDRNNLYGKAMSFPMPNSRFPWLSEEQWSTINCVAHMEDQDIGYFVEVDLEYPSELHHAHNDYLLATERVEVTASVLNVKPVVVAWHYSRGSHRRMLNYYPVSSTRTTMTPST